jgi:hypothetical protein
MLGTNGHQYTRDLQDLRDKRVKVAHDGDTTNIRMPNGVRMNIRNGHSMQGTNYNRIRTCRTCNETKNKKEFYDYSVIEGDRCNNSLNIHCRDCQFAKYASGYKQDGFVVLDEESEEETEESEEEFEVECIRGHRIRNDKYEFLVHWLNYSDDEDTWEPFSGLKHLTIFKNYQKHNPHICSDR